MEYILLLPLGIMLGMAHAFEADHLAAVSAMHDKSDGIIKIIRRGALWGAGHTVSLFVVCMAVFALGLTISGTVEAALECAVGIMIVMLGVFRLVALRRERTHIHAHEHGSVRHIHVHTHAGEKKAHDQSAHRHPQPLAKPLTKPFAKPLISGRKKVFGVGVMHGLAGSAGLLVLMAASADTFVQALAYLLVFGVGSIIGMALLSAVVALPLQMVQRAGGWAPSGMAIGISFVAIFVGGTLAIESLGEIFNLKV